MQRPWQDLFFKFQNFWPFVSKYTHKAVLDQIAASNQIKTEVGKSRVSFININIALQVILSIIFMCFAFLRRKEHYGLYFMLVGRFVCFVRSFLRPSNRTEPSLEDWFLNIILLGGFNPILNSPSPYRHHFFYRFSARGFDPCPLLLFFAYRFISYCWKCALPLKLEVIRHNFRGPHSSSCMPAETDDV